MKQEHNNTNALLGSSPNQSSRRRRVSLQENPNEHQNLSTTMPSNNNNYYNYDDKGSDRDDKGHPCRTKQWRPLWKRKIDYKYSSNDWRQLSTILLSTVLIFAIVIIFLTVLGFLRRLLLFSPSAPLGRQLTDEALNRIRVSISAFDFNERDLGGWKHIRRFFRPTVFVSDPYMNGPDFGGLKVKMPRAAIDSAPGNNDDNNSNSNKRKGQQFLGDISLVMDNKLLSPSRLIHPNDEQLASDYWDEINENDKEHIPSYDMTNEDLEDTKSECRPPSFAKKYYPHCNLMHELTLGDDYDQERAKRPGFDQSYDSFYISHGAFRDVWVIDQPFPGNVKSALKMTRFKLKYNARTFWNTLNDALVMERLTGSPRIVDIYGHCGGSVWVEALPHEVEEVIVPGRGMMKTKNLPKELTPYNDYTVEEKLDIALFMAESLADLHGFRDGVIVHDDVQLCQWLRTKDGKLKLGDFNRAEVMEYNQKKGKYCRYYNGGCGGNYRAPEEYDKQNLNEQIDVYSFGNNIYGLLTGLWVFYDVNDDGVVQEKVIKGTRAYIDPRWKERTFIESKLVDLMEKCWIDDITERIDMFGAVKELRAIKKEHESRNTKNNVLRNS